MNKQRITKEFIKNHFNSTENNLNHCWQILDDLKNLNINGNDFINRFIFFQDILAETIYNLLLIRKKVANEEKYFIENKKRYTSNWFKSKMRSHAHYKKGIDQVVNIAKSIGDAFAYFFYQNEQELLSKHLNHERITNSSADIGKIGELNFLKNIKHIDGHFTLFHDITNILRFGDYSFINLKDLKVEKIGELKTKRVDDTNIVLTLTYLTRNDYLDKEKKIDNTKNITTRDERQLLGIANLLTPDDFGNNYTKNVFNFSYCGEIDKLLSTSKVNKINTIKVSDGLVFILLKSRKTSLYNNIFHGNLKKNYINENNQEIILKTAKQLVKVNSNNNGIIIDQLLYDEDFTDKNITGTIPLFWQPIKTGLLKQLYFYDTIIISLFNPAHIIEKIDDLNYFVDSKYSNIEKDITKHSNEIQRFDLFISYITNFLMTEDFIIDIISQIENDPSIKGDMKLIIKPNQKISI